MKDVARMQIEKPAEMSLLIRDPKPRAINVLLVIAKLKRRVEDPDREPQLVVLRQIDEVFFLD
jgi:hypothetical protein